MFETSMLKIDPIVAIEFKDELEEIDAEDLHELIEEKYNILEFEVDIKKFHDRFGRYLDNTKYYKTYLGGVYDDDNTTPIFLESSGSSDYNPNMYLVNLFIVKFKED